MIFTFWDLIHFGLTVVVVAVHFRALKILLFCSKRYQDTNSYHYAHRGWLEIFDKHGRDLGLYLFRLCLAGSALMFTMNLWHLFTFMQEHMPSIKNISWRIGNLILAVICLILASEFEHESQNNAVS